DDKSVKNAGLRYLNIELFASESIIRLWRHGSHKKKKSDNAVLALSTEAGADLWRIEFSDVKIMGFSIPMRDPRDLDTVDGDAKIIIDFKKVEPDLRGRF